MSNFPLMFSPMEARKMQGHIYVPRYLGIRGEILYGLCCFSPGRENTCFSSLLSKANFIIKDIPADHQRTSRVCLGFCKDIMCQYTKTKSVWQIWMQLIHEKIWASSKARKITCRCGKVLLSNGHLYRYSKTKIGNCKTVCAKIYYKGKKIFKLSLLNF